MRQHPSVLAATTLAMAGIAVAGCGSSSSKTTAGSGYPAARTSAAQNTPASAATTTASTAAATGTVVSAKHDKLGTILAAGSKRLTVYMFEADHGSSSACSGACAQVWPPVTTSGAPTADGAANTSQLGTLTRTDGTKQVTYKGHPLYYYARDQDSGDAYGEGVNGFGADWYVLTPSGNKVDNS